MDMRATMTSILGIWDAGFSRTYFGAGNEVRTRDLNLGKVALYQLSYTRIKTRVLRSSCIIDQYRRIINFRFN